MSQFSFTGPGPLSTAPKPPPTVVAVGGIGSKRDDAYFKAIQAIYPNVVQLPYKGVSPKDMRAELERVLTEHTRNGGNVVAIGHSLGASSLFNLNQKYLGGRMPGVTPMYLDPAVNTPWPRNPLTSALNPSLKELNDAASNGIGKSPYTTAWTGGDSIMYGRNPPHNPFAAPDFPGNAQRAYSFQDLLAKNLGTNLPPDAISAPSTPIAPAIPGKGAR